ncbi:MAG: D-aminoacyl-tRNA deacylase [Candidatus Nanoarchaeia archaeon]
MRVVLQRVKSASVSVDGKIVGECGRGLCLLVGISNEFEESKLDWMVNKILNLRCWSENNWGFDLNVQDIKGEILVVSQFTLHGRVHKGAKPDFSKSMNYEDAQIIYKRFIQKLKEKGVSVQSGEFGAMMEVNIINDGPFTLVLEK